MTHEEFKALKKGDRVKNGFNARPRTVIYVYDDPSGARVVNVSKIQGCSKSIDNFSEYGSETHYTEWRMV